MRFITLLSLAVLGWSLSLPSQAAAIKKCRDAQGKMHYGDRAAEACERSKIIEMNIQGTKTGEIAAPPTGEEIAQMEEQKKREAEQKKIEAEQKRKDDLLLATYGHEKDIIYIRDRKLAQIESSISASQSTIDTLQKTLDRQKKTGAEEAHIKRTEAQLKKHQGVIQTKRQEQEELRKKYAAELERFRVVKQKQLKEDIQQPKKK